MPERLKNAYTADSKRQILVVDDELINREILQSVLEPFYEIMTASDGQEALEAIHKYRETLSLVLLDIRMPVMSGLEVLKSLGTDMECQNIPVIVMTADQESEVACLNLGAIDFIPKPYPDEKVILARITRTIELSEDRRIIHSTERDPLSGLYNRDYFYTYAEKYDRFHREADMDAVVLDIIHFHMINERYGRSYGDEVLSRLGERIRDWVRAGGGLACRREADAFFIYTPHRDEYKPVLETLSQGLSGEAAADSRIRLRLGIYENVDKTLGIEHCFDHAKAAADSVRSSYTRSIGIYNRTLHEMEVYEEQLIEDFPQALAEGQFKVYFQPKYDVKCHPPILASAEALVRWEHPGRGLINPGIFIPLFEKNGLIEELDKHVWREAARQIRIWKESHGEVLPISVNVSRVDMYDPEMVPFLQELIQAEGLEAKDLRLEVTESAYAKDSHQIMETVHLLRSLGFRIEMDDFGTGYSSLNMITTLPIDALKLDMSFIQQAFREGGDSHMLNVAINIANHLGVPVIAEGVETDEQLLLLKNLGCDLVQGYYFSQPIPAKEFEAFIVENQKRKGLKKCRAEEAGAKSGPDKAPSEASSGPEKDGAATPGGDGDKAQKLGTVAFNLRKASVFFMCIAFIAAISLLVVDLAATRGYERMAGASERYISAQMAAANMEISSDYLTDRVRCFVATGDIGYLNDFFTEVTVTKSRDKAVAGLEELLAGGKESAAYRNLAKALVLSNELIGIEYHAMRLVLASGEYDMSAVPDEISGVALTEAEEALTARQMREMALGMVFDDTYMGYKERIREYVRLCTQELLQASRGEFTYVTERLRFLVNDQSIMTFIFLLIVLSLVLFIRSQIRKPLTKLVAVMQEQAVAEPMGAEELQFVTRTYNTILEENKIVNARLSHEASHDALTGLFNRWAYEMLSKSVDASHIALLLIDVDYFKSVNDTYGHDVGDRVLCRVAEVLKKSFRSVDIICRIGGDEFVVIMTRVDSTIEDIVLKKMEKANELLLNPTDGLPPVSLSVGVAFADRKNPQGDIFKDADTALYRVKEAGRNGCRIYE